MPEAPVVVVGGGPGGSLCAARLAQRGRPVVLLEKGRHPRFHLGESLLPCSLPVLAEIGVLDIVASRFLVKRGANFHEDTTGKTKRYAFAEAFDAKSDHAFQVPRDEFDELLFRHAAGVGADAREGWSVSAIRPGEVVAKDPDGNDHVLRAAFVVDASGRDAMMARARGAVARVAGLDKTALYTQMRGVWRDGGEREGDIQIIVSELEAGGGSRQPSWFWWIPFKDGRTSVGAVVSNEWLRAQRGAPPAELFARAIEASPVMRRLVGGAAPLFPPGAVADFTFRVDELAGDGWMAVGDSGGFIDPLFSTGAHLAMRGALEGADAIDDALRAGDVSRARFARWEASMRLGADTFVGVVQAFYAGVLVPYLFAEDQHPFLRRAITSLLAGDVFSEDARWVKELRARFPPRG